MTTDDSKRGVSLSHAVGSMLMDLLQPSTKLIGECLARYTSRQIQNLEKIADIAARNRTVEDEGEISSEALSTKFQIEFLDEASKEDQPEIQVVWAALLNAALSGDLDGEAVQFVKIVSNLSPVMVLVLDAIRCRGNKDPLQSGPSQAEVKLANLSSHKIEVALEGLVSLHLIQFEYYQQADEILESSGLAIDPIVDASVLSRIVDSFSQAIADQKPDINVLYSLETSPVAHVVCQAPLTATGRRFLEMIDQVS